MIYKRIEPSENIKPVVECYWIVEGDVPPEVQKIIPDGFPEIIFHYGKPYKININNTWQLQEKFLLAGQIKKHFFLQNTGAAGIFGIKMKPCALSQLFKLKMISYTDQVVPLSGVLKNIFTEIENEIQGNHNHDTLIDVAEKIFTDLIKNKTIETNAASKAVEIIFEKNGMVTIEELCNACDIGERQLERLFKNFVGLPPKFFARIIRFNYIFQLMTDKSPSWSDIVYEAGFYDQSHFIRNFRDFTGEDPSKYIFESPTLANFFLNKSKKTD